MYNMKFEIKDRVIKRIDNCNNTVGDNSDYEAEFLFDSEWDGHIKTARFIKGGNYAEKILENDKCLIPVEVLKHGNLKVGVFSADMTSTQCEVYVKPSIKESLGSPAEPTPDVYSQIINMIENMGQGGITEEQCRRIVADYVTAHKEELKGEQGIPGVPGADGYTPVRGVDYWTQEDITQIQSYIDGQIGGALNGTY